jgi:hypothetical protein
MPAKTGWGKRPCGDRVLSSHRPTPRIQGRPVVELLTAIFLLQIVTMIFLTVVFKKLNAVIARLEREPPAKTAEKKTEDVQGPQMNVVVGAKVD